MNNDSIVRDRIIGCVFGNAIGNAVGLPAEFLSKKQVMAKWPKGINGYVGDKGDWDDDDTMQMMCLLDEIVAKGRIEPTSLAARLRNWYDTDGRGCGFLVQRVLHNRKFLTAPFEAAHEAWEASGFTNAPNGALMRTSVVGLLRDDVVENTVDACKITHADPRCIGSCVVFTELIHNLVWHGKELSLNEIKEIADRYDSRIVEWVDRAAIGSLDSLDIDKRDSIGYTLIALGSALWAYFHSPDFQSGVVSIVNEGGDSDTNGAIVGALLGAKFGFSGIPAYFKENLADADILMQKAEALADAVMAKR